MPMFLNVPITVSDGVVAGSELIVAFPKFPVDKAFAFSPAKNIFINFHPNSPLRKIGTISCSLYLPTFSASP